MVRQGASPSPLTGPAIDHTTNSALGKYLVMPVMPKTKGNQAKAHIISMGVDIGAVWVKKYCLSLWYMTWGSDVFGFEIHIKTDL